MRPILLVLCAVFVQVSAAQTSNYPGALDTPANLYVAKDNIQTSLTQPVASTDSVLIVASTTGWAANMIATICDTQTGGKCTAWEHMLVTSVINQNTLQVTRGIAGTSAVAHVAGLLVSALIDAVHQGVLSSAVQAIEGALGVNLSNVPVSPLVSSARYNFSPVAPGGSLSVGSNSITVTVNPPLTNMAAGLAVGNSLYILGGAGTPEPVAITGVSSGGVIVTCAYTHSGAWTIQSSSAGVQEALAAAGAGSGVYVPAGTWNIYAQINFLSNQTIVGQSSRTTILDRFFGGSASLLQQPSGVYHIQATIDNSVSTTGYAVNLDKPNSVDDTVVEDFQSFSYNTNLAGHIRVNNIARAHLHNITTGDCTTAAISWGPATVSGGLISDWISSNGGANAVTLLWTSGLIDGSNWNLQGVGANSVGIDISPGTSYASESTIQGVTLDSFGAYGIVAVAGSGTVGGITFSNFRTAIQGIPISLNGVTECAFRNWQIAGSKNSNGAVQVQGGSDLQFSAFNIASAAATSGGFNLGLTTASNQVSIEDSIVGYTTGGAQDANSAFAIYLSAASNGISIVGNKLYGTTGAILTSSWTGTPAVIDSNQGLNDVIPTVASASSIALPFNPIVKISGTTAISTITGGWSGRQVQLIFTGPASLATGGNILRAQSPAANQSLILTFDGTNWY